MQVNQTEDHRSYRSHPFSERVEVIALHLKGYGSKQISRKMGIDDSLIRSWIRKYRAHGLESLRPYIRGNREYMPESRIRHDNENLFGPAMVAYASSLEPVASIARRHRVDYHAFKYYVERYHPELVSQREALRTVGVVVNHQPVGMNKYQNIAK